MEHLAFSIWLLAALFFGIAFAYASVGLGGGSAYTALMALTGVSYTVIPTLSLILNVLVTTIGSFQFVRRGHARARLLLPFLVTSVPCAYLGGSLTVPEETFRWVLFGSLLLVALRIYVWREWTVIRITRPGARLAFALASGSALGLVAGIAGIGGGVYLVPLIILFGLGSERQAAATGAIFVWVNSVSGLAARLTHQPVDLIEFAPAVAAVLLGGWLGSYLGAVRFSPQTMQRILGTIVLLAVLFLGRHLAFPG